MTEKEYREEIERCQRALSEVANAAYASPEARSVIISHIRLKFELARELYQLDNKTQ